MKKMLDGIAYRAGFHRIAEYHGCKFDVRAKGVTPYQGWLIRNGFYEMDELQESLKTFDFAKPIVELGSGMGILTCILRKTQFAHFTHSSSSRLPHYFPFEMDSLANQIAEHNINLNELNIWPNDVWPERLAINYDGRRVVDSRGASRFYDLGNHVVGAGGEIPAMTLLRLFQRYDLFDVNLLMDIEGMEEFVFKHDLDVLTDRVACLVFEAHHQFSKNLWSHVRNLEDNGFTNVGWSGNVLSFHNSKLKTKGT